VTPPDTPATVPGTVTDVVTTVEVPGTVAGVVAVLFDYGHTLVDIRWDESTLVQSEKVLLEALGATGVDVHAFHGLTGELLELAAEAAVDDAEVDYAAVLRAALGRLGVVPGAADLHAAMRAQIHSWDAVRHLHPDAPRLIDELRSRGIRVGYVSNTLDPPDLLLEVMAAEQMAQRADAVILSTAVGWRKPSPRIYQAALTAVGVPAECTLFVGDRVLEDVVGPAREGMATCLATWFRSDEGDHALAGVIATEPMQVLQAVDRVRERG
jgi:putative hydrolase of the HAD superfamily